MHEETIDAIRAEHAEAERARQGRMKPLKHLGLDIIASSGGVPHAEVYEAFGAFLLAQAGYPTDLTVWDRTPDEVFEFDYKGRTWRFQFILVYNVQTCKVEPFRIDFDYIRQAKA